MKKLLISLCVAAALVACGDSTTPGGEGAKLGQGTVSLVIEPTTPVEINSKSGTNDAGANSSSRATTLVDMDKFGVDILNEKGASAAKFSSYSEFPSSLALDAGKYSITSENDGVVYGAQWDKPYYSGTAPFTVVVGETTPVKVVCDLKSTGVKILYSSDLMTKLRDIEVMISSDKGDGKLRDKPNETRDRVGWFSVPKDNKITISGMGVNILTGKDLEFSYTISNPKARELRTATLDVKTTGSSKVTIEVNTEIIEKNVVIVVPDADDVIDNNGDNGSWEEGGETPDPGPSTDKPAIVGQSHEGEPFDMSEVIEIDRTIVPNVLDVLISSKATGGIRNLFLTIQTTHPTFNEALTSLLGITGEIDLANPPSGEGAPLWASMFADPMIGLIDPAAPIAGKAEHLFSVGGLMSLLGGLDQDGGVEHSFCIRVVDANGETIETLTLMLTRP